jgi:hypothetical protein
MQLGIFPVEEQLPRYLAMGLELLKLLIAATDSSMLLFG